MNHDEVYSDTWRDKKSEWLDYVENDVICTAFSYARYIKAMDETTGFSIKECLSLLGLGCINFKSLRKEQDEPIHTYNDKYMRWFIRQSIKGGQVCSFNQCYKSKICDDTFRIIPEELNVKEIIYDIIEVYLNYKKRQKKLKKECEGIFNEYRNEDED